MTSVSHREVTQAVEELVDLVDTSGRVMARGVPRSQACDGLLLQIVIVVVRSPAGILVHRRALSKDVNPGFYDHVCGAVRSGETPQAAAVREAREETGVAVHNLRLVHQGVNSYSRWRWLYAAETDDVPTGWDPSEVAWAGFMTTEDLARAETAGETFVDGFFQDLTAALPATSVGMAAHPMTTPPK
ncbi:NUDIX domain-containing protein [Nonomuraea sp. NPDC059023]|uniref:NUDIX hydrolase n=1 Tax=unclassified Nonomuraea TaxID=2593643 RepID=UPI0036ADF56C